MSLPAGTVTADTAFDAQFIRCAVGTLFSAFLADHIGTVGAPLTAAYADKIHAVFTNTAVVAEVVFTAYTVTADTAFGTKLVRRTVGALFVALLTDCLGTLVASVSANAKILYAIDAFVTLGAVVTSDAVKAALALVAELIIRTVFTFFAARRTDDRAVRATIAAVADLVHTVFTDQTFRAVVALAAGAGEAYSTLNA